MPTVSRFFGILIGMWYDENHHRVPHFHAKYGEHTASVSAESGNVLAGYLPPHKMQLVKAWFLIHQQELLDNWYKMRDEQQPSKIPPLR